MRPAADREQGGEGERGGRGVGWWVVWVLVAIVVYVLSIGPVFRFWPEPVPRAMAVLYSPMEFAYKHSSVAKRAIDWYLRIWGVK